MMADGAGSEASVAAAWSDRLLRECLTLDAAGHASFDWRTLSVVAATVGYMSSGTFDQLMDATRDAAAAPAGVLSDQELTKELMALRRLADVAEAAYLTRLRAFDQAGVSESQQALSTRAWVRHKLHVAPIETTRSLKIAKRLVDLPVIEAALIAGEIRVLHAAAIADAAALLGVDAIAGCQDALVEAAKADDPTRLRAALRGLGAAVDNKKAVKRAEKRAEGRWLDLARTFDDTLAIDGVLPDDDTAAIIEAAISSLAHPTGPDDSRTPAQRRADALVELCRRQLNSGQLPSHVASLPTSRGR